MDWKATYHRKTRWKQERTFYRYHPNNVGVWVPSV